eukprot:CAMPEP_0180242434 /NCGR_PEP_ID=MMETSP0987-20121128/33209_1 /TAXON_ID=697907 /ORGANISM="non described non described, Strain CCMP2293" /LENGTH=64 /DNA_ID=CAMNT_0022209523 /DNA_START=240 /DNA_END=434 /DNA_ORIENTATION=-
MSSIDCLGERGRWGRSSTCSIPGDEAGPCCGERMTRSSSVRSAPPTLGLRVLIAALLKKRVLAS